MDSTLTGKHLCVAAGGTGGHFYPALAIAAEFRRQGGDVTMVVAGQHTDDHVAAAGTWGLKAVSTEAIRLPGRNPLQLLAFPWRFCQTWRQARLRLRELRPTVVLGMGSFASVPVGLAAGSEKIPLVLHEGNALIGRANRFLARRAAVLATSLPLRPGQTSRCRQLCTGLPLRQALLDAAAAPTFPAAYLEEIGFARELPVLLVFGGSQGARAVNGAVAGAAARLGPDATRLQVLHLTGQDDNAALLAAYAQAGVRAAVRQAESRMELALPAAGLVICRAGASTISELALFGKPALLIPLPTAAEDHQTANACMVAERQAGCHLPQAQATPERLAALIRQWLQQPESVSTWGKNARGLATPAAARDIVAILGAL